MLANALLMLNVTLSNVYHYWVSSWLRCEQESWCHRIGNDFSMSISCYNLQFRIILNNELLQVENKWRSILTLPIKKWKKGNTGSDLSDYIPHFSLNVFFAFWWGRFAENNK